MYTESELYKDKNTDTIEIKTEKKSEIDIIYVYI